MPPRKAKGGAAVNPFDKGGNRRLHFNILGRRVVGKDKNVAAARAAASARRDSTLGAEIAASKKANAFTDRRIGEGDAAVDPAAAALARLQKERRRQLGTSAKRARFHLGEDDDEGGGGGGGRRKEELTHLGRSLSDWDAFAGPAGAGKDDARDDDDDDMDALGAEVTAAHFGGGAGASGGGKGPDAPRTHAEIMAEVMAKSKAAKLVRAEDKAAQAVLLQRLDMAVPSIARVLAAAPASRDESAGGGRLVSSAAAKPYAPLPPSARTSGRAGGAGEAEADFDALLHTLATQSRAAIARDRTKTPEEAAAEEAARLTELEALRRARSTADGTGDGRSGRDGDDAATDPALVQFSRAARGVRASVLGGDDLGPDVAEGGALVAKRRQPRALPGASILDLKDKAAAALKAGVVSLEAGGADSDDDGGVGGMGAGGGVRLADSDSSDEGEDGEGEEDESGGASDDEEAEDDDMGVGAAGGYGSDGDLSIDEAGAGSGGASVSVGRHDAAGVPSAGAQRPTAPGQPHRVEEMPFVLPCPTTWADWDALVHRYVAPPDQLPETAGKDAASSASGRKRPRAAMEGGADSTAAAAAAAAQAETAVGELLRRIRACHAVTLKASNKTALEALYAALVEDTGSSSRPPPPSWRLRAVVRCLFAMSQERALVAAAGAAWKAAVRGFAARVQRAAAGGHDMWCTPGELSALRVALTLFPLTDHRHVVVTSVRLLLAQCLTQAAVRTLQDVTTGLAHAALALDATVPARKLFPEALAFVASVLVLPVTNVARAGRPGRPLPLPALLPSFAVDAAAVAAAAPPSTGHGAHPRLRGSAGRWWDAWAAAAQLGLDVIGCGLLLPLPPHVSDSAASWDDLAVSAAVGGGSEPLAGTTIPLAPAPELLDPVANAVAAVLGDPASHALNPAQTARLSHSLEAATARRDAWVAARPPVQLYTGGPAGTSRIAPPAIRMLAPLLEPASGPGGAGDDGGEKAELRNLARARKRELRGAVRELRLDRAYVARTASAAAATRDAERSATTRRLMTFLEEQQAAAKGHAAKGTLKSHAPVGKVAGSAATHAAGKRTKADRVGKRGAGGR